MLRPPQVLWLLQCTCVYVWVAGGREWGCCKAILVLVAHIITSSVTPGFPDISKHISPIATIYHPFPCNVKVLSSLGVLHNLACICLSLNCLFLPFLVTHQS